MSPRDRFLSLVDHKATGRDHGVFRVPTRPDKHMSGTWRELPDGKLLIHDFGESSVEEILDALGLELSDLFAERLEHQARPHSRPFPAMDVLQAIAFEALVVLVAARRIMDGQPIHDQDRDRLATAAGRLQVALDVAGGVHHG